MPNHASIISISLVLFQNLFYFSNSRNRRNTLRATVRKDGMVGTKYEKSKGLIPMGSHSCFGDFPSEFLPEGVKSKLKSAQRARTALLPRIKSDPGLATTTGKVQGFSWNPHLPPDTPPAAGARKRQVIPSSQFRGFYDRGDLPISILHGLGWRKDHLES